MMKAGARAERAVRSARSAENDEQGGKSGRESGCGMKRAGKRIAEWECGELGVKSRGEQGSRGTARNEER